MGDGPLDHPVAPPAEGIPLGPPDLLRGSPQIIPRPAEWRMGASAPWQKLPSSERMPTVDDVRSVFGPWSGPRYLPGRSTGVGAASAVLAPIYEEDGLAHVILTRRSWNLRAHRGEISFPGGRSEPYDADLVATALRETHEEVGIEPSAVEVVGQLPPLMTLSSAFIAPFVGVLRELPEMKPDPREVEEVREVPLSLLLADGVYHQEVWTRDGAEVPLHFFELPGDTVWGATASMLFQLLTRVTGTAGTRGD